MWDLIVSVPDHCLSFYFLRWGGWIKKSVFSFLNALISTKLHFCSKPIYFATNIY